MTNGDVFVVWVIGVTIGTVCTLGITGCEVVRNYQLNSEVIKHGAAYYHPETGEFTWKDAATDAATAESP